MRRERINKKYQTSSTLKVIGDFIKKKYIKKIIFFFCKIKTSFW